MSAAPIPTNGHPVTWRELNLALDPIKTSIEELHTSVRVLADERTERIAVARTVRKRTDSVHFWIGICVVLFAACISGTIAFILAHM